MNDNPFGFGPGRRAMFCMDMLGNMRTVCLLARGRMNGDMEMIPQPEINELRKIATNLKLMAGELLSDYGALARHLHYGQGRDLNDMVSGLIPQMMETLISYVERNEQTSPFSASALLHPEIGAASLTLYYQGHYREAIIRSVNTVRDALRDRAHSQLDAYDLVNFACGNKAPKITFGIGTGDTANSLREGWPNLLRGFMQAIRNVHVHGDARVEVSAQEAARIMVLASTLLDAVRNAYRVVDEDED